MLISLMERIHLHNWLTEFLNVMTTLKTIHLKWMGIDYLSVSEEMTRIFGILPPFTQLNSSLNVQFLCFSTKESEDDVIESSNAA